MNLKDLSIGERIVLAAKLAVAAHLERDREENAREQTVVERDREVQE